MGGQRPRSAGQRDDGGEPAPRPRAGPRRVPRGARRVRLVAQRRLVYDRRDDGRRPRAGAVCGGARPARSVRLRYAAEGATRTAAGGGGGNEAVAHQGDTSLRSHCEAECPLT